MDFRKILKKRPMIPAIFAIVAVISLIAVTPEILNYVEFYKVMEKFEFTLEDVSIDSAKMNQGEIYIAVKFNAYNPTHYSGLRILSITCHLNYIKDHTLQSLHGTTQQFSSQKQVDPLQSITLQVNFTLIYQGQENIRLFIAYLQSNPETVDWIITGQYVMLASANSFAIQMGPFQHATNLHQDSA